MIEGSELDALDRQILGILQYNARSTYAEIGLHVGLRAPAVHERVKRLEARGLVRGYGANVDPRGAGFPLMAFVSCFTTAEARYEEFTATVAGHPEVLEVHSVAGDESFVLKVVARSTAHLDEVLSRLKAVAGIGRTRTTIVLSSALERGVPLLAEDFPVSRTAAMRS